MSFGVVLRHLVRYRIRTAALLALCTCAFATAGTAAATIVESSRTATAQAVVAENGGMDVSIQAVDSERLVPVLARTSGVLPVRDAAVTVSDERGEAVAPAQARFADTSLPLGIVVDGESARAPGEATVSLALARAVQISVGDDVLIDTTLARVTGITQDPADADTTTVVVRAPVPPEDATLWLTSEDTISGDSELSRLLDDRAGTMRTTALLAADRAASSFSSSTLALLGSLPAVVAAVLALVLVGFALLLRPLAGRDVNALAAAGWSRRRGWQLLGTAGLACAATGVVIGTAATVSSLALARGPVSHLFGQDWIDVTIPWAPLALLPLAVLIVPVVVIAAGRGAAALGGSLARKPARRTALVVCGAAALVVLGSLTQVVSVYVGTLACAVLAASIFLALDSSGRRSGPATSELARHLRRQLVPLGIISCVLVFAGSFWSGYVVHNVRALSSYDAAPQPPGSYVLREVPRRVAGTLVSTYRDMGGRDVSAYDLPAESVTSWRVTGTRLVGCLSDSGGTDPTSMPESCYPQRTSAPVSSVALSVDGPTAADPGLVEKGKVGLIQFSTADPGVLQQLARTDATTDPRLGGNLPGLVTAADGRVAKRLGLVPSDARLLAFFDFTTLSVDDRARFRALVTRVAPAAQVAELGVDEDLEAARLARWVAAGSGVVVAVLIALVGTTVVQGQASTRRRLTDLNPTRRVRTAVALRWIGPLLTGVLVSAALGRGAAWLASVHLPGGFGVAWMMPGALATGAAACLVLVFARTPSRSSE